jgi:hypothetical protein
MVLTVKSDYCAKWNLHTDLWYAMFCLGSIQWTLKYYLDESQAAAAWQNGARSRTFPGEATLFTIWILMATIPLWPRWNLARIAPCSLLGIASHWLASHHPSDNCCKVRRVLLWLVLYVRVHQTLRLATHCRCVVCRKWVTILADSAAVGQQKQNADSLATAVVSPSKLAQAVTLLACIRFESRPGHRLL